MFEKYARKGVSEMRHHVKGEDLRGISVTVVDMLEAHGKGGGMIARNPKNEDDQWYVAKKYFNDNFQKV
jgi:hypothetical protein